MLPVLYGDRFIARFEPKFDKKKRTLIIDGWWWENGVRLTDTLEEALVSCLGAFMGYLRAEKIALGRGCRAADGLGWVQAVGAVPWE